MRWNYLLSSFSLPWVNSIPSLVVSGFLRVVALTISIALFMFEVVFLSEFEFTYWSVKWIMQMISSIGSLFWFVRISVTTFSSSWSRWSVLSGGLDGVVDFKIAISLCRFSFSVKSLVVLSWRVISSDCRVVIDCSFVEIESRVVELDFVMSA